MSIDSKHPLYVSHVDEWILLRDSYGGEEAVKAKAEVYLPPTSGMCADGMGPNQQGRKDYDAYVCRAVYHDFVKDAVETLIGIAHHKPADIKLPKAMEPLLDHATVQGESLQTLLRRINEAQLVTGRIGLLVDIPLTVPTGVLPLPYIATYKAEDIFNWDVGRNDSNQVQQLNFVVLNESEHERQPDFEWQIVEKYRVLALGDARPASDTEPAEEAGTYRAGVFRKGGTSTAGFNEAAMKAPSLQGKTLDKVPFIIVNASDIVAAPGQPPLRGLAQLAMTIYRVEADYRQALHFQGQATLVIAGAATEDESGEKTRVGAGAVLNIPQGATAEYISVGDVGLSEMREALTADKKEAQAKGGQLLDTNAGNKESGEALQTRVAAQTATLNQVVLAGAFALKQVLRLIAEWRGLNPDEVEVEPNLDFENIPLTGADLVALVTAKNQGAPLARETIHDQMRRKGMTEKTFEEEMELIEEEEPMGPTITDPLDPNAEDDPPAPGGPPA